MKKVSGTDALNFEECHKMWRTANEVNAEWNLRQVFLLLFLAAAKPGISPLALELFFVTKSYTPLYLSTISSLTPWCYLPL
jgi:hypothetical protein